MNLTSLKLDGNTIRDVSVKEGCAVDFGTQDFTGYTLSDALRPFANSNFDLKVLSTNLVTGKISIQSAESWKKKNDQTGQYDIDASNEANTTIEKNSIIYRFFDKNNGNVYVHGDYECVLVSDKGYKYRVRFTVKPANVSITRKDLTHGEIKVSSANGAPLTFVNNQVANITQGSNLIIDVDFTNAPGY